MVDWDRATYEALQEDTPKSAAIISDQILERVGALENENAFLKESLEDVTLMFRAEDHGWQLITGLATGERLEGLDLSEVKEISEAIRPHVAGDGPVKRGVDLHSGYVWSKGINIDGVKREAGKRGRSTGLQGFYSDPTNQDSLFSSLAHEELQKARYSDGNVFLACNKATNTVRRIPLNQITRIKVNPDFPEEIWAYQRTWNPQTRNSNVKKAWYYTNRSPGPVQKSYTTDGETVSVDADTIIVDRRFNRQVGYPLGIPDAVAAMPWIAAYQEIIQYGRVVSESLSRILFKIINKSKVGSQQSAIKVAGMSGHGNTASFVEGQDVAAIQTAGKGYDFASARPVAAMAAMALNVPNMEFLSDSSAAGSSYGAAQALTPSTKNAMRLIQAGWREMFEEVFDVFSLPTKRVWFDPLEDVDPYRAAQALVLLSTTLEDEEYRGKALDYLDIPGDASKIPEILKTRTTAAQSAASPDQGRSNDTGGGGQGANDQRTDTISQTEAIRRQMADEDLLVRWEAAAARLEAAPV